MVYSYFNHPNTNCMSYFQHWNQSMYFASQMFFGSIKAIIHAFIPNLYKTMTSNLVEDISHRLETKGCNKNKKRKTEPSITLPPSPPNFPVSAPPPSPLMSNNEIIGEDLTN